MDSRGRRAPGDLLLAHPRAARADVQSAPVSAWWAPINRKGRREATSRIALSRSSGRSKFHDWPPGPGR
eukprot:12926859-Prorocentrum_lima.AAC.1